MINRAAKPLLAIATACTLLVSAACGTDTDLADAEAPATANTEPPAAANTEPPATANTEPPATANTEPPATANTEPPATANTEPPATANTEPPATANTEPPATANTEADDRCPDAGIVGDAAGIPIKLFSVDEFLSDLLATDPDGIVTVCKYTDPKLEDMEMRLIDTDYIINIEVHTNTLDMVTLAEPDPFGGETQVLADGTVEYRFDRVCEVYLDHLGVGAYPAPLTPDGVLIEGDAEQSCAIAGAVLAAIR